MSKKLNIGLFGFGVVGQGLYDIIKTKHLNLEIKKMLAPAMAAAQAN